MANRLETYQAIAQLLDTGIPSNELEPIISQPNFDWDGLVVEGSKHLMLPALYYSLKSKRLLHLAPTELINYLTELTAINRNRNKAIIAQIKVITEVFNAHNINYVFLKGAAIIMSNLYEDIGARMIGDIDILVDNKHLNLAFNLLKQEGYYAIETTFGSDYTEHKHLPRLKTDDFIAAVELHRKVLSNYSFEPLSSLNILNGQIVINNISRPTNEQLLLHCILNQQINDRSYKLKMVHFKTAYEVHLLYHRLGQRLNVSLSDNRPIKAYCAYHKYFFKNDDLMETQLSTWSKWQYELRLQNSTYGRIYHRFAYSWSYIEELRSRLKLILFKKAYRRSLWKDRKRIWHTLKQQLIHNKKPQ